MPPPASAPPAGPAPTRPGIAPRPGAVEASPSEATGSRFIRVLLPGGTSGIVLEGETIRAWGVDGRLAAEAAGRVTLAVVGERIRWNGSILLGDTLDAAGAPDLRVGSRKVAGRVRLLARKGELLAVAVVPFEAYVAAVVSREAAPRFHPEALAAMAVAARTYAAGAAAKPRDPAYDVVASVEDQVFDGMDAGCGGLPGGRRPDAGDGGAVSGRARPDGVPLHVRGEDRRRRFRLGEGRPVPEDAAL